jgi:lysophospholipid acyltransferase
MAGLAQEMTPYQAAHRLTSLPNPLEFASFVFSLGNLLAGPYLEFSEYKQFIDSTGVSCGAAVSAV